MSNLWTTKVTSYWGSPLGATYKVVKRTDELWECLRYSSNYNWIKIAKADSKTIGQEMCEEYENTITGI